MPKKSASASRPARNENNTIYIGLAVFFVTFGLLLAGGYFYQKQKQSEVAQAVFSALPTVQMQMQDFTLRTNLSLQLADPDWLSKNKGKVQVVVESALRDTPPEQLSNYTPDKIPQLQAKLTQEIQKKFPKANVEQVLITEFLTSRDTQ
jgi:flagellar basal body-associated protein FliL